MEDCLIYDTAGLYNLNNSSDEDLNNEPSVLTVSFDQSRTFVKFLSTNFDSYNANRVWPCSFTLSDFITNNKQFQKPLVFLELGTGTGALACHLTLSSKHNWKFITSDRADPSITSLISQTFRLNNLDPVQHWMHDWGQDFTNSPKFDILIGADLLIYSKSYKLLVKTLKSLLLPSKVFYMSWQRRMKNEADKDFFKLVEMEGLKAVQQDNRIWKIFA
jgi:phospholipid N-methyltransferase